MAASASRSWPVGFDAAGPPLVPRRRVAGLLGGTVETGVDPTGVGGVEFSVDEGAEAAGDGGFGAEAGALAESVVRAGRPAWGAGGEGEDDCCNEGTVWEVSRVSLDLPNSAHPPRPA